MIPTWLIVVLVLVLAGLLGGLWFWRFYRRVNEATLIFVERRSGASVEQTCAALNVTPATIAYYETRGNLFKDIVRRYADEKKLQPKSRGK